jgi:hypothetical protein
MPFKKKEKVEDVVEVETAPKQKTPKVKPTLETVTETIIENNTPTIANLSEDDSITSSTVNITPEQLKNNTPTENIDGKEMEVVFQVQRNMSDQAVKWEKYISMYNYTPETFLERYPYHVQRKFIEEIIAFRKNNP